MKIVNLFAFFGIVFLSACSDSTPSSSVAERDLRQYIDGASAGHIKLVSFKKTDGQKFEINGVAGYQMDLEAELEFDHDGSWLTGGFGLDTLGYGFTTEQPPSGSWVGFLNATVEGGQAVKRGARSKIAGIMMGTKKESGWHFAPGTSRIIGELPTATIASPASKTAPIADVKSDAEKKLERKCKCVFVLQQIETAKRLWKFDKNKQDSDIPTEADLATFFPDGNPKCPDGGVYSYGRLDTPATCSIPGHDLDFGNTKEFRAYMQQWKRTRDAEDRARQESLNDLRQSSLDSLSPEERARITEKDRLTSERDVCMRNLVIIDGAKAQWALEKHKSSGDTPTWADILPFLGNGGKTTQPLTCPSGGAYVIGAVGVKPTCSSPGHALQ